MLLVLTNVVEIMSAVKEKDLPSFPEFVDKIKSRKGYEIALNGLYHEDKNGQFDDFHTITKAAVEEEIRAGMDISRSRNKIYVYIASLEAKQ